MSLQFINFSVGFQAENKLMMARKASVFERKVTLKATFQKIWCHFSMHWILGEREAENGFVSAENLFINGEATPLRYALFEKLQFSSD